MNRQTTDRHITKQGVRQAEEQHINKVLIIWPNTLLRNTQWHDVTQEQRITVRKTPQTTVQLWTIFW